MLKKHNMLSVNQLNAQIKLTEIWKAMNDEDHPFRITRSSTKTRECQDHKEMERYIQMLSLQEQKTHSLMTV